MAVPTRALLQRVHFTASLELDNKGTAKVEANIYRETAYDMRPLAAYLQDDLFQDR